MIDYSYEILDLLKKYNGDQQAALEGENSPQCLYAFSPLRENLLEWLELEPEDRVLQIGSDYGSVTGLLGRRAGQVVVLDARDENLEVNRLRHGEMGNIRYVRGEIGMWKDGGDEAPAAGGTGSKRKSPESRGIREFCEYPPHQAGADTSADLMGTPFDYVIFAGALEQYKKEDATMIIKSAAGFLRPGGKLIAAAENELGVRYFMGAEKFPVSFLEAEFRGMFSDLQRAEGGSFTIYYPVPDYRYPVTIYSDHYLPETGDVTNISARLDGPGFWFGNEEEVMAKICQNGVFTKFANSFLGVWEKGSL